MISKRISFLFFAITLSFALTGVRLFFIQVWHHEEISTKVNKTIIKNTPEQMCRGGIYDTNGNILAESLKTYSLFADMTVLGDAGELKKNLSSIGIRTDLDRNAKFDNPSYVVVAKNLDYDTTEKIKAWKMNGIGFIPTYQRQHPENLACHVLGVVGSDEKGLEGVELTADSYLSGEKIKEMGHRDGRGRIIHDKLTDENKLAGANVYLTIDRNLQFIAEQEIDKAWRESKSKKAMAIIQDPNTGEILALACRPAYDQGNFAEYLKNLRNPVISDVFEPGSTFKLITAAAALEENMVKRSEVIWCEDGSYKLFDHIIKDHEKKGLLTFDQVLEYSSNIGTAKVGMKLGKQLLYKYIRQFGFGTKTGIDLPGEAKGLLKTPDSWDGLSLPTISFGQGIGVTALQMVNAYSSVANGGELLEPKIIKEIKSPEGKTIYKEDRKVVRRTVSAETAKQLREMLTCVVEKGTGQAARMTGYSVGGKTGTAQKRDPLTKKYSTTAYTASFCGIIPSDKPALTILVIMDEPKGDYYGATRAVPVFSNIAYKAVSYLRMPPKAEPICVAAAPIDKEMKRR